jgi:hypothetical protein
LSHRRQQLLGGDGGGQFRVTKVLAPGGNGPGGHDDNTVSHGVQLCALAHKLDDMGAVQATGPAC